MAAGELSWFFCRGYLLNNPDTFVPYTQAEIDVLGGGWLGGWLRGATARHRSKCWECGDGVDGWVGGWVGDCHSHVVG